MLPTITSPSHSLQSSKISQLPSYSQPNQQNRQIHINSNNAPSKKLNLLPLFLPNPLSPSSIPFHRPHILNFPQVKFPWIIISKRASHKCPMDYRQFSTIKHKNPNSRSRKKQKPPNIEDEHISSEVYNKFTAYLNKRRCAFLNKRLEEYYGKNFPVNYKKNYRFDEQWENNNPFDQGKESVHSNQQTKLEILLSVFTILVFALTIWISNLDFFFGLESEIVISKEVFSLGFLLEVLNGGLKLQKIMKKKSYTQEQRNIVLLVVIKKILTIVYFMVKLLEADDHDSSFWVVFQVIVWVRLYMQASKCYYSLRMLSFSLHYEYQSKLLDMILTIFFVAHFIAIILHSAAKINPNQNWMIPLNLDPSQPLITYVYSYYFGVTTIMTVGYGDITPKNYAEVIVVSMVEIFGIIMYGYMINEIGYCISSLRKNRQLMEKDLFVIEKLKDHYRMSENLTNKVKAYLVNSKPKLDQVSPQQEKGILMKLNQEIRLDMMKQNMASIIRSSIFFLCRWSINFQNTVSSHLIHIMFNPEDILYQPQGIQRIYIVKSGKIHIYAERIGNKRGMNTPLKVLESTIKKEVSDNCYGYSAVISKRPTKIYAMSKDFTSCYYIQKPAFLECVSEKYPDFEYYHEIKNKIDQSNSCQSFQVPLLESTKHHYNPTKSYIIRKDKKASASIRNKRENYLRQERGAFRGTKQVYDEEVSKQFARTYFNSYQTNLQVTEKQVYRRSTEKLTENGSEELVKFVLENEIYDNFHHHFESSKQYSNYFVNHNKQEILKKYQNSFYFPKNNDELQVEFSMKLYQAAAATNRTKINL